MPRKIRDTRRAAREILAAEGGVPEPRFDDGALEDLWAQGAIYRSFDAVHGCRFRVYADQPTVLREWAEA